jgi:hypothetical protein
MNSYSISSFLFGSFLSLLTIMNLSGQDIIIEEVCACENGDQISEFVITFGNWPTNSAEKYEIVINYSVESGGISSVTKTNIFGSPSATTEVSFSSINNPSDPGGLQIERVTNLSSNGNESVSSDFVNYESSNEVVITPPNDTTVSSCVLGGTTTVADFFDDWLSNVNVSGGCGNIHVANDWNGIYPTSCEESILVTFTAMDVSCGDTSSSQAIFKVEDCKAPVPVVVNGLVSVELRPGFCEDVNVNIFDAGSFDDCGEVKFSYSKDISDTLRTFCCEFDNNLREVEFWVTDESGNQEYVVTYLFTEGCEHSHGVEVSGNIAANDGRGVEDVEVVLEDLSSSTPFNQLTRKNGFYTFRDIQLDSPTDFQLKPTKNDDVLNGVSTFDILLIQRHILGLTPISDPYKLIAANINDDDRISGADLIDLRRAILGIDSKFSNNTSWRFVDATHMLREGELPFNYPEEIQFRIFNNGKHNKDFVAVKIGDLDESAQTSNLGSSVAEGYNSPVLIKSTDKIVDKGDRIEIAITSDHFKAVQGFQMTLDFKSDILEFVDLAGGVVNLGKGNYAHFEEAGALTMSWNASESISSRSDEVLFTIFFKAKQKAQLSEAIEASSSITQSEVYIKSERRKLTLHFEKETKEFDLFQNAPNPMESHTVIGFVLPESANAVLNIYDAVGKRVFSQGKAYEEGYNQIYIKRADLPLKGVYYYELRSGDQRETKKMIIWNK